MILAALRGQHAEVLLGRAVEGERRVVLLGDVRGVLDPEALDDVALDVEADDVLGVLLRLVGAPGELDPAGLASTGSFSVNSLKKPSLTNSTPGIEASRSATSHARA